ncbi:MAG TPA: penicillin-binding protein 2 [Candidatus Polarisedimenticolaceae bacterium]|nr:penicillin-binding protein 2 [Candidatus Polarisedimenticolaceae bacterium]
MSPPLAAKSSSQRLDWLYISVVLLGILTVGRLFYIQIIQHNHFAQLAVNEHQRKYEVPAERGQIYLLDGDTKVPLALNQRLKLLYADPSIISDKRGTAERLASATGQPVTKYLKAMEQGKEYALLESRINAKTADKIKALRLRGVGLKDQNYRTYPEGSLGSQVLGFVNSDGKGQYGIEGYLNRELSGVPGHLNAKTDTNGVPIASSDNLDRAPIRGTNVVLTLDRSIQAQAEKFLAEGVTSVRAESGSVIVMDPNTGAIKAMANYPTFDPNDYGRVTDYRVFSNAIVSDNFEPGSVFKIFTMASGLDAGKITPDTTYNDVGCEKVDKYDVCNAENHKLGPNTTMTVALRDSLNTGVMFVLKLLGSDPVTITKASKQVFHRYVTQQFRFGQRTGIEQAGEASGFVNPPTTSNVTYANMAFGQGISVTTLQTATAVGAIANGGKLYKPYLVDQYIKADGKVVGNQPKVVNPQVISKQAAKDLGTMMEVVVHHGSGYRAYTPGYQIAGKTGTAQIANPNGPGYLTDKNIGTFAGFAPVEAPKFVVMVRINKPNTPGFAEVTTVPVFANLTRWLLQYYAVPPSG